MGITPSVVEQLQNGQSMVNLTGKDITTLAYELPDKMTVQTLNLSYNRISQLPQKLTGLKALSLAHNQYKSIPKQIEQCIINYKDLISIDLSNNFLTTLPKSLLFHPSITEINVFGNNFSKIDLSASNIVYLNIGRNKLEQIPKLGQKTEIISAELNMITDFPPSSPALTRLFLSMNKIQSIPAGISFENLTILDLSRNQISSFPPSLKEIFPNLVVLDLSFNLLVKLPSLPSKIYELTVNNNKITSLPKLNTYLHLNSINFSYNSVRKVSAIPRKMQIFIADNNKITSMDGCETKKLIKFSINQNKLTEFPYHLNNRLKKYIIRGNLIQTIDIRVFHQKLAYIDLTNNEIEVLPKELFLSECLKTLILQHNKIKELPAGIENSILLDLNLSFNPLKYFPPILPKNLERLSIAGCSLAVLPNSIEKLEELVELDVSDNYLSSLPHLENLQKFYASKNRFASIPKFCNVIEEVDLSFNRMMQLTPQNVPYFHENLLTLDISCNQITSFPPIKCESLQYLSLRKNPFKGEIDCSGMPQLEVLHTVQQTSVINLNPECEVYSSNRTLSSGFTFIHTLDNSFSYVQAKGSALIHDDIILSKSRVFGSAKLLGYVLATKDPKVAIAFSEKLVEKLSKYKKLNQINIIKSLEKAEKTVEDHATMLDPSQTAFIIYNKPTMFYAGYTQVPIFVLNDKKEIRCVNESRWPRKALNNAINYLVFQTLPTPNVGEIKLEPNDKLMIITNVNVCDILGKNVFTEICQTAKDERELAFGLRNVARANNKYDNLTVIIYNLTTFLS